MFREFQFSELKEFKGAKLVQGWKIVSTLSIQDEKENKRTVDNWVSREKHDVEQDLKVFLSKLMSSCNNHINNCSNESMSSLTCLDLDTIFNLLCGECLTRGKVKLAVGKSPLTDTVKKRFTNSLAMYVPWIMSRSSAESMKKQNYFGSFFAHIIFH